MDDAKIEKATRRARFLLSDGTDVDGDVFVGLYEPHHIGPQRVGELINDEGPFLPVKTGGGTLLLNRRHVVHVTMPSEWEADELATLGKRYTVVVSLVTGQSLDGVIFVNLREGASRVKDYFNQPVAFLPLFRQGWIVYLNRDFIRSIQD